MFDMRVPCEMCVEPDAEVLDCCLLLNSVVVESQCELRGLGLCSGMLWFDISAAGKRVPLRCSIEIEDLARFGVDFVVLVDWCVSPKAPCHRRTPGCVPWGSSMLRSAMCLGRHSRGWATGLRPGAFHVGPGLLVPRRGALDG